MTSDILFKEWSVIVQALLEGRQILILRKGGISETEGRFTIESREFFLYPTKVHQNPKDLVNVADQQVIAAAEGQIAEDHVLLKAFSHVEHYERVTDLARIQALRKYHVWSDSLIEQRFHWGNEDWLDVFVLKVFRLPQPLELKNDSKFAGCKSWIHLQKPLSAPGVLPVMAEEQFQQRLKEVLELLQKTAKKSATITE